MKNTRKLSLCFWLSLLLVPGLGLQSAHAGYYVYQLPDGSRLVTDRPKHAAKYKLIQRSRKMKNLGRVVAKGYQASPTVNYLRFEPIIQQAAERHKVDAALVKAVIRTESYFNPNATSHKGASGLMQLMPQTARLYGVTDLYSPRQNVDAGVRHLKYLLKRYRNKLKLAIAAYNAGEEAVEHYNGVPPYRETRNYVKKVLRFHQIYSAWP